MEKVALVVRKSRRQPGGRMRGGRDGEVERISGKAKGI